MRFPLPISSSIENPEPDRDEVQRMLERNFEQLEVLKKITAEEKRKKRKVLQNQVSERRKPRQISSSPLEKSTTVHHEKNFTFIDLFAGIGGFRIAFESAGGKCVFASEWDRFSVTTYFANFSHYPDGDITKIPSSEIPKHDVLTAGFPCQPFSIAGVTKHNALGNEHGFRHKTQGTLFFDVARIIEECKPKAFVLENVKGLISHDKGKTYATILETLRSELKYQVFELLIDAKQRLPQHRERIYLVGFRSDVETTSFRAPSFAGRRKSLRKILDQNVESKYTLTDHLWQYLQNYAAKHREKGNGFGYSLVNLDGITRTLSARYHKDGSEILIPQEGQNPRRLTPRECARLMGFPASFQIPVSDTQAYRQFGNSVAVPVVTEIARRVRDCLFSKDNHELMSQSSREITKFNTVGK
jgi:DNA (cytosine-5)-methyltransferase 1